MSGFKRPPKPRSVDDFIGGAGVPPPVPASAGPAQTSAPADKNADTAGVTVVPRQTNTSRVVQTPWAGARPDVIKAFMLRLPETHLAMLKFISENTPESMQSFCQKTLFPAIESKITELTKLRNS